MTTVLITGVAGLLGSRLADWILANHPDVNIVGIDDLSGGYRENVDSRVKFHKLNLVDSNVDIVGACKPDVVFHFAAYAAEALSPFIRKYNYQNNLVATAGIVTSCIRHSVKRLVFTSSMSVYGHGVPPFAESHVRAPIDPYGVAKAACEQDIEIAGAQHGLDWCIIRPHNFYGIKQNIWDSYRNVLGIWMYKRLTGQPLTVFGNGQQVRAFSFIDDALPCLWTAAWNPQCSREIINLGGIEETSILKASEILRCVTGGGEIQFLAARHEVKHAVPTWQKSVDLLGFEHKTDLETGLRAMWSWAQQQPMRPRQVWRQYELDKGVYPFWQQRTLIDEATTSTWVSK